MTMSDDKWCPENDGAYRAEVAEMHRGTIGEMRRLQAELLAARAKLEAAEKLAEAVREFRPTKSGGLRLRDALAAWEAAQ